MPAVVKDVDLTNKQVRHEKYNQSMRKNIIRAQTAAHINTQVP
jgi:hypothetical protein